jgi:HEAT repeat protein
VADFSDQTDLSLSLGGPELVVELAERMKLSGSSRDALEVCRLLSQIAPEKRSVIERAIAVLADLVRRDVDSNVTARAIEILGNYRNSAGARVVLEAMSNSSSEVRAMVAANLGFLIDDENAIPVEASLVQLSNDDEESVRDWATIALAQLVLYSSAADYFAKSSITRNALADRTRDNDSTVRGEALIGLALRDDQSVMRLLREELTGYSVSVESVRAAEILGSKELVDALERLSTWWQEGGDALDNALSASRNSK